jgi:hypothetical protein
MNVAGVERCGHLGSGFIGPHQQRTMSPVPAGDPVVIAALLYLCSNQNPRYLFARLDCIVKTA